MCWKTRQKYAKTEPNAFLGQIFLSGGGGNMG